MNYREQFYYNTINHIELVNKYAAKLGKSYPDHDKSKLNELFEPYALMCKDDRSADEQLMLDKATLIHIKNAPHHPEYWTNTSLKGFTRNNYIPNGPIDATTMPNEYLEQMCCDWQATGDAKGNDAFTWFNAVNGTRWIFTPAQQQFIIPTLEVINE